MYIYCNFISETVLDRLSQAPYSKILRWLLVCFSFFLDIFKGWISTHWHSRYDPPVDPFLGEWKRCHGHSAVWTAVNLCQGTGLDDRQTCFTCMSGRSPKAAQETRGEFPLVSIVFPNREHLPPIKSAAVDESVQADDCDCPLQRPLVKRMLAKLFLHIAVASLSLFRPRSCSLS